jgi:Zn-finger protein
VKIAAVPLFAVGFAAPLYACTETAKIAKHHAIYGEAVPFCSNCHVVRKSEELIVLKMC